ncbi:hypothetical protein POF50_001265 [Streptomyces sp. SL13]|uniref:Uncharacterized protein n=1 Tax=Streptantibioticus silvisoli TaxID=2705255 RepID=A0AA90K776_9ACTN|nr:hypothetical protein [Streptantibioticus silvisoli]MDI5961893.1 hypothetical protein [Streptantibioticus silvisoli]MDI5967992.1 hypothetical protein [Streptantibioticus silvisoli]
MRAAADPTIPPEGASVPAGVEWDAIRTPRPMGLAALRRLSAPEGAVLVDPVGRALFFFVRPGTAQNWCLPLTVALGKGHLVELPPGGRDRPPGAYWLAASTCLVLTLARPLHLALRAVLTSMHSTEESS